MIRGPYTIFTHIPVYSAPDKRVFTGALWAKDLELHLDCIAPFALCCPVLQMADDPEDAVAVSGLSTDQLYPGTVSRSHA